MTNGNVANVALGAERGGIGGSKVPQRDARLFVCAQIVHKPVVTGGKDSEDQRLLPQDNIGTNFGPLKLVPKTIQNLKSGGKVMLKTHTGEKERPRVSESGQEIRGFAPGVIAVFTLSIDLPHRGVGFSGSWR